MHFCFQPTAQSLTRDETEIFAAKTAPSALTHHSVTQPAFNSDAANDRLIAAKHHLVSSTVNTADDLSCTRQSRSSPQATETAIDKTPEWHRLHDELARCRQSCFQYDSNDGAVSFDEMHSKDHVRFLAEVGNTLSNLRLENTQLAESVKKKDAVVREYMQLKTKIMDAVEVDDADADYNLADIFVHTISEYHRLCAENKEISENLRVTSAQLMQLRELNTVLQDEVQRLRSEIHTTKFDERKSTGSCQTKGDVGATRLSELIRQQVVILRQSLLRQIDEYRQQKLALELERNANFKQKHEESLKLPNGHLENGGIVAKCTRRSDVNNNEASSSHQGDVSLEEQQSEDATDSRNAVRVNTAECSSPQLVTHSQPVAAASADETSKRKRSTSDRLSSETGRESLTTVAARTTSGGKLSNHTDTVDQPKQTTERVADKRLDADDRRCSRTTPTPAVKKQTTQANKGGLRDKQSSTSDDERSDGSNRSNDKKSRLRAMKTVENLANISTDCLEVDFIQYGDSRHGSRRRDNDVQRIPTSSQRSTRHSEQHEPDDSAAELVSYAPTKRRDKCRQRRISTEVRNERQRKRHDRRRTERRLHDQQIPDHDDAEEYQPEAIVDRPANYASSSGDPKENRVSTNGTYTFLSEDEHNSTIKFKGMNGMEHQFVGNFNFLQQSAAADDSSDSSSSLSDDSDVAATVQTPRNRSWETKTHVTSTSGRPTAARGQQVTKTAKLGAGFDRLENPDTSGTDEGDRTSSTFTIRAADDGAVLKQSSHGKVQPDVRHEKGVKKTVCDLETRISHLELSMRGVTTDRLHNKLATAADDQTTANYCERGVREQLSNRRVVKLQTQVEELRRQLMVINAQVLIS